MDSFSDVYLGADRLFIGIAVICDKVKPDSVVVFRRVIGSAVFSVYGYLDYGVVGRNIFDVKIFSRDHHGASDHLCLCCFQCYISYGAVEAIRSAI